MEGIVLFLAAAAFTMLNGANDGGTLVAVGLTVRGISPIVAVVGLALAVAIVPVLIGTRVATTLTSRLVSLDGDAGRLALLTAVVSAVAVTAGLSWRGLPTSLTLALVGGIAGVGWGYALPLSWPFIGLVLLLAAVAPLAGLAAAFGLSRISTRLSAPGGIDRRIRRMHLLAFTLQCVAYGANDGQKMLAVFTVASGPVIGAVATPPTRMAVIGLLFLVGGVLGLRRFAGSIGGGVVPVRPPRGCRHRAGLGGGSARHGRTGRTGEHDAGNLGRPDRQRNHERL